MLDYRFVNMIQNSCILYEFKHSTPLALQITLSLKIISTTLTCFFFFLNNKFVHFPSSRTACLWELSHSQFRFYSPLIFFFFCCVQQEKKKYLKQKKKKKKKKKNSVARQRDVYFIILSFFLKDILVII